MKNNPQKNKVILILAIAGILVVSFFINRGNMFKMKDYSEIRTSENIYTQPTKGDYVLNDDEKQKIDNFCSDVKSQKENGVFFTDIVQLQGKDWSDSYFCFEEKGMSLIVVEMKNGLLQKPIFKQSKSVLLPKIAQKFLDVNFSIDSSKKEFSEADMFDHGFGSCHSEHRVVATLENKKYDGWYVEACASPNPKETFFETNMSGDIQSLFSFLENTESI